MYHLSSLNGESVRESFDSMFVKKKSPKTKFKDRAQFEPTQYKLRTQ